MPRDNDFNFDLYRLTVRDAEALLPFMGELIRTDEQIISVLKSACRAQLDYRQETSGAIYLWGLRDFTELPSDDYPRTKAIAITLAKATVEKEGVIITPDTVQLGTSIAQPPPASVVLLVFQMTRHLVAVEVKSTVTNGHGWLHALHEILRRAASRANFTSRIEFQTKPKKAEILKTFNSFQRLTRIKVQLLLPNHELSRLTQGLYDELKNGGIREYIADMRNPSGLSQQEQTLPHAAAAMAEDGYKNGEVLMEGIREGHKETVKTGTRPARGKVEGIKDFVRGQATTARTQEGKIITDAILKEIDRLADDPEAA